MAANHIHAFRDLVSGEFVAILNDDDEWEPAFLSQLVPHLLNDPEWYSRFPTITKSTSRAALTRLRPRPTRADGVATCSLPGFIALFGAVLWR